MNTIKIKAMRSILNAAAAGREIEYQNEAGEWKVMEEAQPFDLEPERYRIRRVWNYSVHRAAVVISTEDEVLKADPHQFLYALENDVAATAAIVLVIGSDGLLVVKNRAGKTGGRAFAPVSEAA